MSVTSMEMKCHKLKMKGNPIILHVLNALTKVESECNYRSLFDNKDGIDSLNTEVQELCDTVRKKKDASSGEFEMLTYKPQYKGEFVELIAAYDNW